MLRLRFRTYLNFAFFVLNIFLLLRIHYENSVDNSIVQNNNEAVDQNKKYLFDEQESKENVEAHPKVIDVAFGLPVTKWNNDWDGLEKASFEARQNLKVPQIRRLYLVRHGNYHIDGERQGHLNEKGDKQAHLVGNRIKTLNVTFDKFISSTSKRAKETTEIIQYYISKPEVKYSAELKEGKPTFPEPKYPSNWNPSDQDFQSDGPRLDKAFRQYIHRSITPSDHMTNEIIVCHGNVIAYFVLRALQVAPQRWMKISIFQGSITVLDILPNGQTSLRLLGDVGHLSQNLWTG